MNREQVLADILHQIRHNGGRVNTLSFIAKMQVYYGRTEAKIIEYLKLLEATGKLVTRDYYTELVDKTGVKAPEPEKKSVNKGDEDEVDELLDKS